MNIRSGVTGFEKRDLQDRGKKVEKFITHEKRGEGLGVKKPWEA